jgi:hypothetical protein
MDTIAYRAPRLSRAKALIGALLATLAIAGVTQAGAPDSASAAKNQCWKWVEAGYAWEAVGSQYLADLMYDEYTRCIRGTKAS